MSRRQSGSGIEIDPTITASDAAASDVSLPIDALTSGRAFGERYRIIRFIGHGGMGDVHEAEDLSLRHRVALKTIRAERAADALALERFRREALLARRVTHRNVCRVFDVGFHAGAMFLTMELLDGETLSARIKRGGRMSVDEALAIVEQIVAALGAAHRAGVVHRDLKCSNVMLCGDRVVVTDFGLAHDATAADHERSREGFAGSPAYVAPEQVNGQRISFAIDVYALGVVMYEMVTGQLPFVGATPMATAVMRLNEPPPSPRTVVPTLPAAWERTILRCLELKPADRFASAEDVLAALQSRPVAPPRRRQRQQRAWLAAIAATIGVAASAAGVVGWRARHHRAATATTTAEARRTLAIAEVADRSAAADDTWRATAIAELLAAQLEGGDALRVLPRATAAGRDHAQLARQGATLALDGELRPDGDGVTLSTRIVELPGGRVVAAADVSGPSSSLLDLAARAAAQLRSGLGLPAPTAAQATWTRSVLPTRPEAARRYSEGLTALRRFDPAAAQRAFAAALAVEPDQPIVHAAQAQAWHELESEERERQEAKRAFELSSGLPREQRLSIEAAYREAFKDWANAAELRMSLATFFPDNVDYGLALAEAQRRAGHNDEALATLARLRRLPPPDGGDPRIDVAEANVRSRTDKPAALAAAKRAVESARQRGAIGVEADAHVIECTVEAAAAHVEPAAAACQQAIRLFGEQGNKAGIARATVAMVALYQAARRPAERDRWEQQALALYRELGSRVGEERVHMTMAIAYKRLGDYDKAEKLARGAVDFMRAAGEPQIAIKALDDLAAIITDEGKYDEALPYYRQVIAGAHEQGLKNTEANAMSNLSILLTRRGELVEARRYAEGAVALWKKLGQKNDWVYGLDSQLQIALRQGRYEDAMSVGEEALAARLSLGFIGGPSRQNLATIELSRGNVARAEAMARKAADEFRAQEPAGEPLALEVLTRVLVRANKIEDAAATNARARELATKRGLVPMIAGSTAMVKAAKGDVAGALALLQPTIADAEKAGDVDNELDALDVQAELLARDGTPEQAKRAIATLRQTAAAHGYGCMLDDAALFERRLSAREKR